MSRMLLSDSIISIFIKLAGVALSFLVSLVLARSLGANGFGEYSYVFALVTIFAIPIQAGLPVLIVREAANAKYDADWSRARGIWIWACKYSCIFFVFVSPLFVALGFFQNDIDAGLFWGGAVVILAIALPNLISAYFRGLGSVVWGQLPNVLLRPLLFLLLIFFVLLSEDGLTPEMAMVMQCLSGAGVLLISLIYMRTAYSQALKGERSGEGKVWLVQLLPLAGISGLQIINQQSDVIMLGAMKSPEVVGSYKVAIMISGLVAFGLQAVNMVIAPRIVGLIRSGDRDRLQRLVSESSAYIFIAGLVCFVLFVLLGEWFLGFFYGAEYVSAFFPLVALCFGQLINAGFGSVGLLLNMSKNERSTLKGVAIAAVLNLCLNGVMVPIWGAMGASIATALTFLVWNMILRIEVKKRLGIEPLFILNFRWLGGK